jgi:8-oxo-dGTP pyrophosphatase MutT (NUDIX family)
LPTLHAAISIDLARRVRYNGRSFREGSQVSDKQTAPIDVPARPAATALILRDGRDGIEVFMVVRHHEIDFASGALVFPGGKVDADDADTAWDGLVAAAPADGLARSFAVAALRETFEEAGILIARPRGSDGLVDAGEAHRIVLANRAGGASTRFIDLIRGADLTLAMDLLVRFAHWITPVGLPKRFDTHFFLVAAPVGQAGAHDGSESIEGFWIRPADALRDAAEGRRSIVPATRLNLQRLSQSATVAEAVAAARAASVVTVMPKVRRNPDGSRTLQIPAEAGYGVSELFIPAGERTAAGR